MTANNSKPKNAAGPAVIVLQEEHSDVRRYVFRLAPAALASILFHGVLIGLFVAFALMSAEGAPATEKAPEDSTINADQVADDNKVPFTTVDVDPAMQEASTD